MGATNARGYRLSQGESFIPQGLELTNPVDHPAHYTSHPSGIECIQITEHMGFNLGNALKYIWRADLKDNRTQDIEKAIWYLQRELAKNKSEATEDAQESRCEWNVPVGYVPRPTRPDPD